MIWFHLSSIATFSQSFSGFPLLLFKAETEKPQDLWEVLFFAAALMYYILTHCFIGTSVESLRLELAPKGRCRFGKNLESSWVTYNKLLSENRAKALQLIVHLYGSIFFKHRQWACFNLQNTSGTLRLRSHYKDIFAVFAFIQSDSRQMFKKSLYEHS